MAAEVIWYGIVWCIACGELREHSVDISESIGETTLFFNLVDQLLV